MNRRIAVPFAVPDRETSSPTRHRAQKPRRASHRRAGAACSATTSTKGRNRQTPAPFAVQNPSASRKSKPKPHRSRQPRQPQTPRARIVARTAGPPPEAARAVALHRDHAGLIRKGIALLRSQLTRYPAGEITRDALPIHPEAWYAEQRSARCAVRRSRNLDTTARTASLPTAPRCRTTA